MKTQAVASFFSGALFAIGLAVSGMTQPAKIIGFLDVFGDWNPSLVFVLASAVGVYYVSFQFVTKRKTPLLGPKFFVPTRSDLDMRLIAGGLLFGAGWGISGLCPGPILSTVATGTAPVLVLLVFMLVGLYTSARIGKKWL
ncbi:MAG: YeeE/YedE family protein [Proteobacteria bacterium]|nr:YeeE/YedE family protein [Pseudomonadota bacterium]